MKTVKISQWVEALRSGKFEQAQSVLRGDGVAPGSSAYCCLGVLCQIADKFEPNGDVLFGLDPDDWDDWNDLRSVEENAEILGVTKNSVDAAGFTPTFRKDHPGFNTFDEYLMGLNDNELYSFAQIADEIEKYCDPNAEVVFWEEGDEL